MRTNVRIALVCALAGGAAMLGYGPRYLAADPPPRCPCTDPTPDNAKISPAKFAGEYGLHVCAFHVGKANPGLQVESHHYSTATPLQCGRDAIVAEKFHRRTNSAASASVGLQCGRDAIVAEKSPRS